MNIIRIIPCLTLLHKIKKMALIKEKRILESLKSNGDIRAIRIVTTSDNFENRFQGSISLFFRTLKNSLNSVGSVSNRSFFKNLSGCYFSLEETESFEIIILYDSSITQLTQNQVIIRIKKLLGFNCKIEFGDFNDYESRIKEMIGIVRKTQTFGDFYFNKQKL
jgi:hypothetical protein